MMCRTKSRKAAIDPKPPTSRPKPMTKSVSVDPSTSSNFTGGSSYTWQSSVSVSSVASLSSARETLPENPHIFDFSEICSATNNFLAKKLSSSASSSVTWRCVVGGRDVAVIQRKLRRRAHTEEICDRLSSVCRSHHASLIKLRGVSLSGNYIYLVYDYVQGATLADCLRNARNSNFSVLSSWMPRVQIASDLAHGLDYIHNSTGARSTFVHNHIKSSSVIVTEPGLHAKICHFGTAELCGEGETESESKSKFVGTRGYMSPEFRVSGVATHKSDVYAFGVVILEILSGEEPLKYKNDDASGGYRRISVVETAREVVEGEGVCVRSWMDKRLRDSYPVEVAQKMVRVGLDCVEEDPGKRPDMGRVVGRISKLYLESKIWADNIRRYADYSVSLAPR